MKWFKRRTPEQRVPSVSVPWTVEYRLRLLHMPNDNDDNCTGCGHPWSECPTLAIVDRYFTHD